MSNTLLLATTVAWEVLHNKSIQTEQWKLAEKRREARMRKSSEATLRLLSPLIFLPSSTKTPRVCCKPETTRIVKKERRNCGIFAVLDTSKTAQCNFQCGKVVELQMGSWEEMEKIPGRWSVCLWSCCSLPTCWWAFFWHRSAAQSLGVQRVRCLLKQRTVEASNETMCRTSSKRKVQGQRKWWNSDSQSDEANLWWWPLDKGRWI